MNFNNVKLAICLPLTFPYIPVEFFDSMMAMKKPCRHVFLRVGGYQGLDQVRNKLVEAAINYDCTHVLFLDVDHNHNPETITKLFSHNKPIVSGLNYMRNDPFEPCMFKGMINKYETITEWVDGDLIEVDSVGAACLLVDINVFKNIQSPYFSFMKNPDLNIPFDIGEDVYFCNKAKQVGYKIYVDTSLETNHLATIEINKKFNQIWDKGAK